MSFRFKIALTTALLCGMVLAAFGLSAWALIYRERIQNLDKSLIVSFEMHRGLLRIPRLRSLIQRMPLSDFRTPSGAPLAAAIVVKQNGELMGSGNWPKDFIPDFGARTPEALPPGSHGSLSEPPDGQMEDGVTTNNTAWPEVSSRSEFIERLRARGPRTFPNPIGGGPPGNQGPPPWGGGRFSPGQGPERRPMRRPDPVTDTFRVKEESWRIAMVREPEADLFMAVNMDAFNAELRQVRNAFLLAFPFALGLVAAGGWHVSKDALKPLKLIGKTAERVTAKGLDQRIREISTDAEIRHLIHVINGMLDRLEASFLQANRFSADASHELKTPLAIMQGEIESALKSASPDSAEQHFLNNLLNEVQRLKNITQSLLLLSKADGGKLNVGAQKTDAGEMLQAVAEDAAILAEASGVTVHLIMERQTFCNLDPGLMQLVLSNLVGNAVKYNRPEGSVHLRLFHQGALAVFQVENTGPGISISHQDRIFERFYRGENAHSRQIDGFGLGLSLAKEIIKAHGGDLKLLESRNDKTVFEFQLPLLG